MTESDVRAYYFALERFECIAMANEDQDLGAGTDEVYFGVAVATADSAGSDITQTQTGVTTGGVYQFPRTGLRLGYQESGPIRGGLAIHLQGWEQDNGKSPVRDTAANILGKAADFMRLGLKSGRPPVGAKGAVTGMWNAVAGATGLAALILEGMNDDLIGEGTIVFTEADLNGLERGQKIEHSVEIGEWYQQSNEITGNTWKASSEGAYCVYASVEYTHNISGADLT